MRTTYDYLVRPCSRTEQNERVEARVPADCWRVAVKLVEEDGAAPEDYLDKNACRLAARALRKGIKRLEQEGQTLPALHHRADIARSVTYLRPAEALASSQLPAATKASLLELADLLDGEAGAAGVLVTRAMPRL